MAVRISLDMSLHRLARKQMETGIRVQGCNSTDYSVQCQPTPSTPTTPSTPSATTPAAPQASATTTTQAKQTPAVKAAPARKHNVPKTGDADTILAYAATLFMSVIGLGVALFARKKREQ